MITVQDVLTSSGKYPEREAMTNPEIRANAADTAARVSKMLGAFGYKRKLSSGFRDAVSNKSAGGAQLSAHLSGRAVDIEDPDGRLAVYILTHQVQLMYCDLYMEDPWKTPGWVHLQTRLTKQRIFTP